MDRRDFLKTTAALAALGVAAKAGKLFAASPAKQSGAPKTGAPDMVAVKGGEPAQMFDLGIKELGGMQKFVKKGRPLSSSRISGGIKPLSTEPIRILIWSGASSSTVKRRAHPESMCSTRHAVRGT